DYHSSWINEGTSMNQALVFGAVVTQGLGLLLRRLCAPAARTPRPCSRRPSKRVFPQIEWLEDRTVPNAYTFRVAASDWNTQGSWNDANGNQTQLIPGANDTATIPSTATCTVDNFASASSVNIQDGGSLIVGAGRQLTVSGGITNNGALYVPGTVIGSAWNDHYCYLSGRIQGDVNNSQELEINGGSITESLGQDSGSTLVVTANGGTIGGSFWNGGTVSFKDVYTTLSVSNAFNQV